MNNFVACALGSLLACSLLLHQHQSMDATTTEEDGVFEQGRHQISLHRVAEARRRCSRAEAAGKEKEHLPPKPLLVAAPKEAGEYPVLLFLHGYLTVNSFYSQLLGHVASHGFITVGPQMYTFSGPETTDEINAAAGVIDWLAGGLPSVLPTGVRADPTRISIAGHSRGGKVAFALALGHAEFSPKLAALVAVDPVDGMGVGRQTPPPILTCTKNASLSLRVPAPVMVIGTGLGELPNGPLLPPCAPRGVSHQEFYDECAARGGKCHLVARDYGHTDMMDDDTGGARGMLTRALCRSGGARAPMRRFVAGATVAFLRKVTRGDGAALHRIRAHPETAPVALSVVQFVDE